MSVETRERNAEAALSATIGLIIIAFGALGYSLDMLASPKLGWIVSVAGVSMLGFAYALHHNCVPFGVLIVALFIGGAAQLWMTEPLWFPTLRLRPESDLDLLMIALIAIQGAIVAATLLFTGALRRLGVFFSAFGMLRILLFLGFCAIFLISPLGYLSFGGLKPYVTHLVAAALVMGLNLLTVVALLSVPSPSLGKYTFHPLVPATFAFLTACILCWFAFQHMPHVEDEVAFLFQAQSLSKGVLTVPAPPEAAIAGLEYYLLEVRDGRWLATTPPGWTGLLAVGVLFGVPWVINPLLAFAAVLLAHNITLRLADRTQANLVAILMAASPWFLGTSASLMPHNITLALTLFAWWALLQNRRLLMWALLAGLAMGWIVVARQLEGLILGTLTGLWLLSRVSKIGFGTLVLYALGCVIGASFYLGFNAALTGDPLLDPLARYLNDLWGRGANGYGFGSEIGPPGGWGALDLEPGHSPFEAFINFVNNMSAVSIEFLGWGTGSLVLFWAYVLLCKPTRFEWAMIVVSIAILIALAFYWFSGSFYIGPRYWFSCFFPLLLLSASAFRALQERLLRVGVTHGASSVVLFVLCAYGVAVFTTWRGVEKYHEYGGFRTLPPEIVDMDDNALVFFDPEFIDAGSVFSLNDPWLRDGYPLFVRDLGSAVNTEVINAFSGRKVIYLGKQD